MKKKMRDKIQRDLARKENGGYGTLRVPLFDSFTGFPRNESFLIVDCGGFVEAFTGYQYGDYSYLKERGIVPLYKINVKIKDSYNLRGMRRRFREIPDNTSLEKIKEIMKVESTTDSLVLFE